MTSICLEIESFRRVKLPGKALILFESDSNTSPSSQHRAALGCVVRRRADLSDVQALMGDDLIDLLGVYNGTGDTADEATRIKLWNHVFAGGWDTNCTNPHPEPLRERRGVEAMIRVGSFNANLPPSVPAKRKAAREGTVASPPAHRQAGAPAFMKPNINWDDYGINWMLVDSKSAGVNPRFVQYHNNWTAEQARAEAVIHFDRHERTRIGEYNLSLVVHWTRGRLLCHLQRHVHPAGATANTASDVRPIGLGNEGTEDHSELKTLRTCADILAAHAAISTRVQEIAATRGTCHKASHWLQLTK